MRTQALWAEAEDNLLFGYAGIHQVAGNAFFSAVILNPNFVIDDVHMDDATMHILAIIPTDFE